MVDDRRSARRARISGVRVTYESAAGDRVEAEALDLATGGLFVSTAAPLAVGKRIALEMQVVGEKTPWTALGRVIWVRGQSEGEDRPSGMGVKLIDVEDAVVEAIGRLVETRERTEPGVGSGLASRGKGAPVVAVPPPQRERTVLGVGAPASSESPESPASPSPPAAPAPSAPPPPPAPPQTPAAGAPDREQSIAIDLVAKKESPSAPPAAPPAAAPPPQPAAAPRAQSAAVAARTLSSEPPSARGGGRGWIAILLLAVALVTAYVLWQGGLLTRIATTAPTIEAPPAPSPLPPPPPAPSSAPHDTTGAPSVTAAPSAPLAPGAASDAAAPSASAAPSAKPPGGRAAPSRRPAAPARKPSTESPY